MANKINAKTTRETLEEKFDGNAKILKDISALFTFAAAATAGEPLTWATGAALVLKSAGATLSAGVNIVRRLVTSDESEGKDILPKYDRFRVLFYVACQRSYIETLSEALKSIEFRVAEEKDFPKPKKKEVDQIRGELAMRVADLEEAEVSYLFGIEPLEKDVPLFDAFGRWLSPALRYHGVEPDYIRKIVEQCKTESRKRFRVELAEDDPASSWMRNYLAISYQEETTAKVTSDLGSIRLVLEQWTDPIAEMKAQKREAWSDYREVLKQLPDQKETMFNEQFGVRKVFLPPQVKYHVAGMAGEAGTPKVASDIGRLFGALTSNRTSGEDLIILCGGPGSGKSTLCRILSSELANNSDVHPVFLRLRRAKEGSDVSYFIEESLQKLGMISRFADLREVPNLILILDGFDELVMASRSRLRHFFNVLREELTTGPLRKAKAIVSGRDTLFPAGEGLPWGSHVLSLLPFDKERVKKWGTKWRALHKSGPGHTFRPETFLESNGKKPKSSPLHHLVSWPLTLHLVARVHTAGKLELGGGDRGTEIEKAYLYRSILAETATRQFEKGDTKGRLDPSKMRAFLRSLAWQMYSRSIDSMDPTDVVPLLTQFFPQAGETDVAELAEVAVVSSPELTKGEETGFEFVHKSFSEFLVAEQLADCIERVGFKTKDYKGDLAWQMSDDDAAGELASVIGLRLVTEEVQEMLEPMLGCLVPFLAGDKVDEVVSSTHRKDGLSRIVERFEILYELFLRGISLDLIDSRTKGKLLITSPLEAYANYCAGLLIIGTAAAHQLGSFKSKGKKARHTYFNGEPFPGALWRCISLLHAGGLTVDENVAHRLFRQLSVTNEGKPTLGDADMPWKPAALQHVHGYNHTIQESAVDLAGSIAALEVYANMSSLLFLSGIHTYPHPGEPRYERFDFRDSRYRRRSIGTLGPDSTFDRHIELLVRAGLMHPVLKHEIRSYDRIFEEISELIYRFSEELQRRDPDEHFVMEFRERMRYALRDVLERMGRPRSSSEDLLYRLVREQMELFDRDIKLPYDRVRR